MQTSRRSRRLAASTANHRKAASVRAWSLAVGDVNADNNPDIYVVDGKAGTTTNAPDYVLLGNLLGNATGGFTTHSNKRRQGDRAYPLDYNHDGLTDFLILNGQDHYPGPTQLLTPHP